MGLSPEWRTNSTRAANTSFLLSQPGKDPVAHPHSEGFQTGCYLCHHALSLPDSGLKFGSITIKVSWISLYSIHTTDSREPQMFSGGKIVRFSNGKKSYSFNLLLLLLWPKAMTQFKKPRAKRKFPITLFAKVLVTLIQSIT